MINDLERDLVTNGDLDHAVADAAVALVDLGNTKVVASIEHEITDLV